MAQYRTDERDPTPRRAQIYQLVPQQPRLSMVWITDRETGRPVARWVTAQATTGIAVKTAAA